MRIGLDVLGGDYAPEATILGAIQAREELPEHVRLVLIGDEEAIYGVLDREGVDHGLFDVVHTTEKIAMGDHPTKAFLKKPNSSIGLGFSMLKKQELDAFASAGNSGAMLVGSMYTVRAVSGVIRPCITTALPKEDGGVVILLDVGINADCKADVLYQFGILGAIYAELIHGMTNPKVALLNIGEEEEKGNLLSQATHVLMKDSKDFHFCGNIEGRDIFTGAADVIVCDGFTGNVVLKEAEAIYTLIRKRKIKDTYFDRFNYELYGGTPILGVDSNVIIGHGISSPLAIKNMLKLASEVVEAKLSEKIKKAFM
ncbi:MAG: phosphate acyltransferase PlsX [Bacteroidota bacterium]